MSSAGVHWRFINDDPVTQTPEEKEISEKLVVNKLSQEMESEKNDYKTRRKLMRKTFQYRGIWILSTPAPSIQEVNRKFKLLELSKYVRLVWIFDHSSCHSAMSS